MMEEESWVCVDEILSSDENNLDSDRVDSETEAELYSLIHFEGNLSSLNSQFLTTKKDTELDATNCFSNKMKYVISTEMKGSNGQTKFSDNSSNFLQNCHNDNTITENCDTTYSDDSLLEITAENEEIFSRNFVNNSNENQLAQTQSSNITNKRKGDDNLLTYSSPPKKAATDFGRKNILMDVDSSRNKGIQMNIFEDDSDGSDIIFISSDSEDDNSSPSKMMTSEPQNRSMPNIKIGESSKGLWFVNQEDICRARNIKSRRYHDKVDITCSNCDRKGHHSRVCSLPRTIKCFICGGNHIVTACMNRMCGKCYGTGHDRRSCRMSNVFNCALCHMQGHIKKNCPDLWRRYHLTTQPGKIVPDKVQQNSFIFCCNCGRPGHFGAVCNFEHKGYKNCFPTWPNVVSYNEPYSLPVQTPNTTKEKQGRKKDLVIQRKKVLTEAEKLARKEIIKKRKKERKKLKRQEFLNSNEIHKVLKEKDFPRTPKDNRSSPQTPQNKFSPGTKRYDSSLNLSSFMSENNFAENLSSPKTLSDDSVIIIPNPKTKKKFPVIDLDSPKTKKNKKNRPQNFAFDYSSDLPESIQLVMLAQARRTEKNRQRRIRKRNNRLLRESKQKQNMST